jgi:hypothetical protein
MRIVVNAAAFLVLAGGAAAQPTEPDFPTAAQRALIEAHLPSPPDHYHRYYKSNGNYTYRGIQLGVLARFVRAVFIPIKPGEKSDTTNVGNGMLPLLTGDGCIFVFFGNIKCTSAAFWLPSREQIERLEATLVLPYGAGAPSQFVRYYAGIGKTIQASYVRASGEMSQGYYFVSDAELPEDHSDLGCSVLSASFDADDLRLLTSSCGTLPDH